MVYVKYKWPKKISLTAIWESWNHFNKKVKSVTVVKGDQEACFSIATIPRCWGGRYSFPWIAPFYS